VSVPDAVACRLADTAFADSVLRGCLDDFALIRLTVSGDCMTPALRPGDTVILAPPRRYRPRLGDIVLVRIATGLRLHRLVPGWPSRSSARRTKADRAAYWDPPVAPGDLLGAVVGLEREGRALPRPARVAPVLCSLVRAALRYARTPVGTMDA
jgi:hypothetical protein